MASKIVLVTDVTCEVVPYHATELRIEELEAPRAILTPEELEAYETVSRTRHRAKVHEFRGGPFGEEGIKIAFGPAVERELRIPLKCLEEQLQQQVRRICGLEDDKQDLRNAVNTHVDALNRYAEASFWQRLKWAFTGGAL